MDEKKANALVSWVNSLGLSSTCTTLNDLSDGIVLSEALCNMDPSHFDTISGDPSENWLVKSSNLKKLLRQIDAWYIEKLNIKEPVDLVDVGRISKEGDLQHLFLLMELVVGVAVECPNKNEYIQRILSALTESQQHQLMLIIKRVMDRHKASAAAATLTPLAHKPESRVAPPPSPGDDELHRLVAKLKEDNAKLEMKVEDSALEVNSLSSENARLRMEKDSLLCAVGELEEKIAAREDEDGRPQGGGALSDGGNASGLLSAERGAELEEEVRVLLEQQHLMEEDMMLKDTQVAELAKQVDELRPFEAEARRLKDELDLMQEKVTASSAAVERVQRMEKKMEELSDLRRQTKVLMDQNKQLSAKASALEDEDKRMRAKLEAAQAQNARIKVAASRMAGDAEDSGAHSASSAAELGEENELLRSQLSSVQTELSRVRDELDAALLATPRSARGAPLDAMVPPPSPKSDPYRARIDTLEKENASLKAHLADAQKDHAMLQDAHEANVAKIKSMKMNAGGDGGHMEEKLKEYSNRAKKAESRLQTAKNVIIELRKKKQEPPTSGSAVETYEETIRTLKNQLEEARRDVDRHKTFIKESKESVEREQRLLVSAFYEVGLKLARTHAPSTQSKSLLNKIRET